MGLLDSLSGMLNQAQNSGNTNAQVAGGLVQAADEHPGGFGAILDSFRNNGLGDHVQNWQQGNGAPISQDHVEQGLGPTGLIDTIAQKAGVSPTVAKGALAVILPMAIAHFSQQNNGEMPQGGALGGLAGGLLSRFL